MRERIKDYDRLLHIREAIANVYEFMEGKNVNDLVNDKLLLKFPTPTEAAVVGIDSFNNRY